MISIIHSWKIISADQMKLLELKSNGDIVDSHPKLALDLFWQKVDNLYPTLKSIAKKVLVMYGSSYSCEQLFSPINCTKNKLRNRLTKEHLICQLRASLNNYAAKFASIKGLTD